jgi:fucose 4-O-acetylase-like acetyltransferase
MSTITDQIQQIYLIDYRPDIRFKTTHAAAKFYNGLSLLKGILMIFVIWGHLIPKGVYGDITAFLIYSFHMPLFLGLSGYLINSKFIELSNYKELWSKYAKKVLLFWGLAWIIYGLMEHFVMGRFYSVQDVIYFLFFPGMHLWYIPALLFYINLLYLFKKMGWHDWKILFFSFALAILSVYNFEYVHVWTDWYQTIPGDFYLNYRPQYFFFFMLGYSIKKFKLEKSTAAYLKLMLPLLIGMRVITFYLPALNREFYTWDFYLLNIVLIVLIFPYFNQNELFERKLKISKLFRIIYKPIMWLGINSLHIYLWHALAKYPILIFHLL